MMTAASSVQHTFDSKSLCFRNFPNLLVLYTNTLSPTDAEWEVCMKAVASHRPNLAKLRVLTLTNSAGPTAAQRKRLSTEIAGAPIKIAVVTDNTAVRFINSTVALFAKNLASFGKAELPNAFNYLSLNLEERRQALAAINTMQPLLG